MSQQANGTETRADKNSIVVKVGALGHFAMTSRKWNSERQVGEIAFEDSHGTEYRCEALGLMEPEIRQAIYDEIVRVKVRGGDRLHGDRCGCHYCT